MSVRTWMLAARSGSDGRVTRVLRNGVRLAKARLKYGIHPFEFSLYGMGGRPESEWPDFLTEKEFQGTARAYAPAAAQVLADDKLLFHEHCVRHGLRTVPVAGIVSNHAQYDASPYRVHDAAALGALIQRHGLPLFFKRMQGGHGKGAFRLTAQGDRLRFLDMTGGIDEVLAYCYRRAQGELGYLIQPIIDVHPSLEPLLSPHGVGTTRITTIDDGEGHRLLAAAARFTTGTNVTDNFAHGAAGNLVGEVDLVSGRIVRCTASRTTTWPDMTSVVRHPDTGAVIIGFELPDWEAALDLVHRAAPTVPVLRLIGWDIAFTPTGPVIVEMNARPNADIHQVALQRGLRADVRRLLNERPERGRRASRRRFVRGTA
jgi:hypothetical protein